MSVCFHILSWSLTVNKTIVLFRIWIGLADSDEGKQFRWIDNGYLLQWTNWNNRYQSEPAFRRCVSRLRNGEWIERFCDYQLHFYCEQKGTKNRL